MALVKIPTPLRRLTNEKDEVSTSSTTVESMIADLAVSYTHLTLPTTPYV